MTPLALSPCPRCGSSMTERTADGDLDCLTCGCQTYPPRPEPLAWPGPRGARQSQTRITADERTRLYVLARTSGLTVSAVVRTMLGDCRWLPPGDAPDGVAAVVGVILTDAELAQLAELSDEDAPVSVILRRLIRWGLPLLEREHRGAEEVQRATASAHQ